MNGYAIVVLGIMVSSILMCAWALADWLHHRHPKGQTYDYPTTMARARAADATPARSTRR